MRRAVTILAAVFLLTLAGCTEKEQAAEGEKFMHITQEEAKKMMAVDDGHVIVDVRREDEYEEGHIPGAILIPNESIINDPPEELPDFDRIILVYCRSGRRSMEASRKLAEMGYTNVYEFGGIESWTGEVVKESKPAPVIEQHETDPIAIVQVIVGDRAFSIDLAGNSSAEAFLSKLKEEPITVEMADFGSFEKVGDLPWKLPENNEQITTRPGDVILYQGDKITIYYAENTWNFTRLGTLNATEEEVRDFFGGTDSITAEFSVEWTE